MSSAIRSSLTYETLGVDKILQAIADGVSASSLYDTVVAVKLEEDSNYELFEQLIGFSAETIEIAEENDVPREALDLYDDITQSAEGNILVLKFSSRKYASDFMRKSIPVNDHAASVNGKKVELDA